MELKQGYKYTEVGVIPSDWQVYELNDVLQRIADVDHYMPKTENFGYPYVMTGDLKERLSDIDFASCKKISLEYYSKLSKKIKNVKGDILLARYATVGTVSYVDIQCEFIVSYSCVTIKPNTSKVLGMYLFNYFKSHIFKNEVRNKVNANIQDNVGIGDLLKMQIPLPLLPEQTAIANALSDMDTLISQTEKLIEKKKAIKQGAMHELLKPKEGWVTKKLGDVCEIKKGQLITDSTRINGSIPVIAGGKSPAYYHNKANRLGKTITISGSGASAGYVAFHTQPIFASDCSTISEAKNYRLEFIFYWLQLNQFRIYKMQTGGAQPHIHPSDLNPLEFNLPPIEQQNEISDALYCADLEISFLELKLNKLKRQKQGMMQVLLTGKIRLVS